MDNTLQVPAIDVRTSIPATVISSLAERIAERFKPQKIILFGSYAHGSVTAESDIDLLVIMDTPLRARQQAVQIRQYLDPLFGVDLLVYTPEEISRRLAWGDSFLQEALSHGKLLYESSYP